MNQIHNDETDLFELFQTLSNTKWLIGGFVVLSTLIGFGYSKITEPIYKVSVPYTINIYSLKAKQLCEGNIECLEYESTKNFSILFGGNWSSDFSFLTTSPLDLSKYKAQLKSINEKLSNQLYEEATIEVSLIQSQLSEAMLSREITARNMINAKRLIQFIDIGQSPLTFGDVSVVKSSPKTHLIISLSCVLGGLIGVFFVLLRNSLQKQKGSWLKRKKQLKG